MRLRILNKIPPTVLALLIIALLLINKNSEKEKEREEVRKKNLEIEMKKDRVQGNKEIEKPNKQDKEAEASENTLQKAQEKYNEEIRKEHEKKDQALAGNKQEIRQEQNKESIIKAAEEKIKDNNINVKPAIREAPIKASEKIKEAVNEIELYKKAIENDKDLQLSKETFKGIVTLAKDVLKSAPNPKILLLAFVHEDNTVFANNWLCNTQVMNIHSSLIIVTYGNESREFLTRKWPSVKLFSIEPDTPEENLRGKPLTIQKLQIIYVLLNAGVNVLLLDVESVWFSNPVPGFKAGDKDMMVNTASTFQINTGFIVLFATEKNKHFWGSLYLKVKQFENQPELSIEAKFDNLLKTMAHSRFGNVTLNELPGESYVEGMWYELPGEERQKTRPIVIRNNNLMGFAKRIRRAVSWKHWFVKDGNCDLEGVSNLVKTAPSV